MGARSDPADESAGSYWSECRPEAERSARNNANKLAHGTPGMTLDAKLADWQRHQVLSDASQRFDDG